MEARWQNHVPTAGRLGRGPPTPLLKPAKPPRRSGGVVSGAVFVGRTSLQKPPSPPCPPRNHPATRQTTQKKNLKDLELNKNNYICKTKTNKKHDKKIRRKRERDSNLQGFGYFTDNG